MLVAEIEATEQDGVRELSASVDGYRLWYRFPVKFKPASPGNAFLVATLLPAMARGETLEIDSRFPVCPLLLRRLETVQEVFVAWAAAMRVPFNRVAIRAQTSLQEPTSQEIGSFFSGGVDGTFTLLRHLEEVTSLIFVKGIDMQLTNDGLYDEVWQANVDFAKTVGRPIVPVASNIRFFARAHACPWPACMGAGLASIAHALGLRQALIASGDYYADLVPYGSHPLTDPLWSSSSLEVIHDGSGTQRIEKLRRIAEFAPALKVLRVCWQDKAFNCGKCEKCLRAMVQLRVLGIDAPTFAPLTDLTNVRKLYLWEDAELAFVRESLALASQGSDAPLQQALRACVRRNEMRRLLRRTDELLLGGRVSKMRRWLRSHYDAFAGALTNQASAPRDRSLSSYEVPSTASIATKAQ